MLKISELKTTPSLELFSELVELVQDAVGGGASIGWTQRPGTKEARNYWTEVLESVGRGERLLFVATDDHVCAGAVQLALTSKPNGRHRGEVQKLMVHSQYRRRGIAQALMERLENAAAARGLTLLVLDTRAGDPAEALYRRLGWQFAGSIPGYAQSTEGAYESNAIYWRRLAPAAGEF
ncbi:MAG: N-acetyltransferase [Steroidobacteraceae bacterium]|jgi:ribosomal protein S18 acetylase RimI-like enzyme|nr:N-acetyltransferase [Steroidobacteraceae bacterium]